MAFSHFFLFSLFLSFSISVSSFVSVYLFFSLSVFLFFFLPPSLLIFVLLYFFFFNIIAFLSFILSPSGSFSLFLTSSHYLCFFLIFPFLWLSEFLHYSLFLSFSFRFFPPLFPLCIFFFNIAYIVSISFYISLLLFSSPSLSLSLCAFLYRSHFLVFFFSLSVINLSPSFFLNFRLIMLITH